MENLQEFTNEQFGTVRCFIDDNGTAHLNVEDVARGLGFVMTRNERVTTSGDNYSAVRWNRVNEYLADFGYPPVDKDDYIPENIFYRLAMKAKNAAAEKFQAWIADEVIPNIRKFGIYATPAAVEKFLNDPDVMIRILQEVKNQRDKINEQSQIISDQQEHIGVLENQVNALVPKATYYDLVLNSPNLITTTSIAKEYGYSAVRFNKLLNKLGIQFKQGGVWYLYQTYANLGWASTSAQTFNLPDGTIQTKYFTKWTHKGRLGLYQLLKSKGIRPLCERVEDDEYEDC